MALIQRDASLGEGAESGEADVEGAGMSYLLYALAAGINLTLFLAYGGVTSVVAVGFFLGMIVGQFFGRFYD